MLIEFEDLRPLHSGDIPLSLLTKILVSLSFLVQRKRSVFSLMLPVAKLMALTVAQSQTSSMSSHWKTHSLEIHGSVRFPCIHNLDKEEQLVIRWVESQNLLARLQILSANRAFAAPARLLVVKALPVLKLSILRSSQECI